MISEIMSPYIPTLNKLIMLIDKSFTMQPINVDFMAALA